MKNFISAIFRIIEKLIFLLIILAIIMFCINNSQDVVLSLRPINWEIETKLFILILFLFFSGILIGYLLQSYNLIKEKFRNYINNIRIGSLKKAVIKKDEANKKLIEKQKIKINEKKI